MAAAMASVHCLLLSSLLSSRALSSFILFVKAIKAESRRVGRGFCAPGSIFCSFSFDLGPRVMILFPKFWLPVQGFLWQGLGDHMGYQGLGLGQQNAGLVPY